jgi:Fe-S oxidoreductase
MHAGDGNVHVNIPVLSNDRAMLRRADAVVEKVFERVEELGGVVSGEHGIGVTKLKYWDPQRRAELEAYRRVVDPTGLMNPGKLSDLSLIDQVYTPSFNLLKLEARILQHGQLEELAKRIATCVRCGKCKPDCCVYYPARGMFYHPRNKNLAIGALIEALLFDAQRQRSGSFELLRHLEEVADHCTICHKCLKPCPVDIDTGEVTVMEREILAAFGFKDVPLATRLTLKYLDTRSRVGNAVLRTGLVRIGGAVQRAGHSVAGPFLRPDGESRLLATLRSPVTPADPGTLRDVLPECRADQALVFEPEGEARRTVFYFPGCGSERLVSRISQAMIHVQLQTGTRVVLPPPFLCCGFPAHANARTEQHSRTVLRNTILFSQIREMFSHLTFDAVVVSCGTCMEGLEGMEVEKIFGAPLRDGVEFALDGGLKLPGDAPVLYHTPCHDSLAGRGVETLRRAGYAAEAVPHCCSEAGTLALSRPDITDSMLHRKATAIREAMEGRPRSTPILTNCPSCVQGLGRNASLGATPRHLAVEVATRLSGEAWPERFRSQAAQAKAVRF